MQSASQWITSPKVNAWVKQQQERRVISPAAITTVGIELLDDRQLSTLAAQARREVEVRQVECFAHMSNARFAEATQSAKAVRNASYVLIAALTLMRGASKIGRMTKEVLV